MCVLSTGSQEKTIKHIVLLKDFSRIDVSGLPYMKLRVIICIKRLVYLKTLHENSKLMIPDFDSQKNTLALILFFNLDFSGYF